MIILIPLVLLFTNPLCAVLFRNPVEAGISRERTQSEGIPRELLQSPESEFSENVHLPYGIGLEAKGGHKGGAGGATTPSYPRESTPSHERTTESGTGGMSERAQRNILVYAVPVKTQEPYRQQQKGQQRLGPVQQSTETEETSGPQRGNAVAPTKIVVEIETPQSPESESPERKQGHQQQQNTMESPESRYGNQQQNLQNPQPERRFRQQNRNQNTYPKENTQQMETAEEEGVGMQYTTPTRCPPDTVAAENGGCLALTSERGDFSATSENCRKKAMQLSDKTCFRGFLAEPRSPKQIQQIQRLLQRSGETEAFVGGIENRRSERMRAEQKPHFFWKSDLSPIPSQQISQETSGEQQQENQTTTTRCLTVGTNSNMNLLRVENCMGPKGRGVVAACWFEVVPVSPQDCRKLSIY